jgi:acetyl-CoA acetyltransferase
MSDRKSIQDAVAIVGVGSTGFHGHAADRSRTALALDACVAAIGDAGLGRSDIDGVCGTVPDPARIVEALGLTDVTHHARQVPPFGFSVIDAVHAIHAGACTTALAYHSVARTPYTSRSAAADPFRRHLTFDGGPPLLPGRTDPESVEGAVGYAAWAGRYLYETGRGREDFGLVARNARAHAARNPLAARREPLSMQQYLAARMIREPLCLADLDIAVDGADALVLMSAEKARDVVERPVLIHAAAVGITAPVDEAQAAGLHRHGQHVTVEMLRRRSELWLDDIDLVYAYDGCSFLTLAWLENLGYCGFGEAGELLTAASDPSGTVLLSGRIPLNTHGGGLAEGATQGSGHIREAVHQLRGTAGERQHNGARSALVALGGFFYNAQGLVLRSR